MSAPQRIGVYGGTFDPIHIGHMVLAESAREVANLDRVLFIPTAQSVFKQNLRLTPPDLRRRMCEAACSGNDGFEVDDREIVRGGQSYTIDTLRELHEVYPEARFFLIVGSDVLAKLSEWREATSIAKLATVVAFERPGEMPSNAQRDHLRELGFEIDFYKGPQLEIHSHNLREKVAEGLSIRYLVPESVRQIIIEKRLYEYESSESTSTPATDEAMPNAENPSIDEVLSKDFYRQRKAELAERVDQRRLRHSVGVAKTARKLAKTYDVDPDKARLAGILHDWDKGLSASELTERIGELGMESEVDPWALANAPGVLHGHTAAKALAKRYPSMPADVIEAIENHTTAAAEMSDLDKVLYIADALEPSRNFPGLDDLRALVGKVSLDELFFLTYRLWTELLMERGRLLHPATIDLWNEFALQRSRTKGIS